MSRTNQQLVRLLQQLIRGVQTGQIKLRWIVGLVTLAIGYFLLQPMLERSLGIDLPGLSDVVTGNRAQRDQRSTAADSPQHPAIDTSSQEGELWEIYRSGRGTYVSPAGLRYTRGSQQGHRLKHLMAHARDQPNRPGSHGVFDSNDVQAVVSLVDEAYRQAQAGRDTRTQREEERTVYDVNLRRPIGYIGGQHGKRRDRPPARHLRIVLDGDRLITAFPFSP